MIKRFFFLTNKSYSIIISYDIYNRKLQASPVLPNYMNEIKNIFIEGTLKTPQIDFSQHTGELILSGRSIPENAAKIYDPLLLWANEYIKSPCNITNLRLNLEYLNTSTTIWLAKLIRSLGQIKKEDCILVIHIYLDDEEPVDMNTDEIRDIVGSLFDSIGEIQISIALKIYAVDSNGKILKEATVLF